MIAVGCVKRTALRTVPLDLKLHVGAGSTLSFKRYWLPAAPQPSSDSQGRLFRAHEPILSSIGDRISGELAATATPPKGVSRPTVSGGCAACRFVDRDAGFDIDHHWIKLAPLQSYEIKRESHSIILMGAGRWLVDAGYVPMREDTQSFYQSALNERGCTLLPELHSPKVRVLVKTSVR